MKNWKLITIAVALLLVAIIVFQNTEEVSTKLLFVEFTMPRAILLMGTFAIGAAVGVLYTLRRQQLKERAASQAGKQSA